MSLLTRGCRHDLTRESDVFAPPQGMLRAGWRGNCVLIVWWISQHHQLSSRGKKVIWRFGYRFNRMIDSVEIGLSRSGWDHPGGRIKVITLTHCSIVLSLHVNSRNYPGINSSEEEFGAKSENTTLVTGKIERVSLVNRDARGRERERCSLLAIFDILTLLRAT